MSVRVSVVVAAKDEEKRIGRCVLSLIRSIGSADEIIVVNDGSTDRTAEILRSIEFERLRVITNPRPQGRAASRNAGVAAALGRYIAIQDADDEALPGRIEIPVAMLDADPKLVAASGQCIAVNRWGVLWRHRQYATDRDAIRREFQASVMAVCHTGSVIRRSALERVGLYDPSFVRAQDLDLFKRLAADGPIANSPADVVLYSHDAWLSWSYWRLSRSHHDVIAGRASLPYPLLVGRYLMSMIRRSFRLVFTHTAAKVAFAQTNRPNP